MKMNFGVVALYMAVGISTNILQVLCSECYYTRLGVKRDATPGQIKQAFRRQAKIYHPDRNKDKKAAEKKFIELTKAYEVLSDENKRRQYDAMGHANYERNMANGDQGGAHSNFHHFSFDEVFKRFFPEESGDSGHGGFHFSFGDDMFGQANDGMHHKFHQQMHEQAHQAGHFGSFDSFFGDFGNPQFAGDGGFFHHEASESRGGQRCRTVTKTVGSMTTTYTECS